MSDDDTARNRAQEELEMLLARVPVGIFRTGVEGECLLVNEQWCRLAPR